MLHKTILIADDEEQTCFCISMALKMKGFNTVTANDGEKALQIISERKNTLEPIDLMICDIQMPRMNGEDLLDKLNELQIRLPVVVITGFGEKDLVVRLMRKGCRDFVDKPFDPAEIEKRVEQIFTIENGKALEKQRTETMARIGVRTRQIVHDMNNVLGGVLGYAEMALDDLEPDHPTREHIAKMSKATIRASEICQTLLASSRSIQESTFVSTEMNALMHRSAEILKDIIASNIHIEIETAAGPLWCRINGERVQQAILNLGLNAAQAMPKGGRLALHCAGRADNDGWSVRLTVHDTGAGIPKEHLDRLFAPGFSTRTSGNGIGLATVKEIVEEHGGRIAVVSEVGNGTTFTIDFMSKRKDPAGPVVPSTPA